MPTIYKNECLKYFKGCIVIYSVGNESPENGSSFGNRVGRRLVETIRSMDGTHFITNRMCRRVKRSIDRYFCRVSIRNEVTDVKS